MSLVKRPFVRVCLLVILLTLVGRAWCQELESGLKQTRLLETAIKRAAGGRAGFHLLHFSVRSPSRPRFKPINGLEGPGAVSFLIRVLRNGPEPLHSTVFQDEGGIHSHIARCYSALCLGVIGDKRALGSLVEVLGESETTGGHSADQGEKRKEYPLSEYAALGLGYLGDTAAVEPVLRILPARGQRYERVAIALALLGDIRAVVPLIEHATQQGTMGYNVHQCLEDLTHAEFPIQYISGQRTYRVLDFPELGELSADRVYLSLWQHWNRQGSAHARRQFEKTYTVWQRRQEIGYKGVGLNSDERLFKEMTRGGLATLPFLMARIEAGDASMVPYIGPFVVPIRRPKTDLRAKPIDLKSRSECLEWWGNNRNKYAMQFHTNGIND